MRVPVFVESFNDAEFTQPLVTALQIAILHLFRRLGIKPSFVVGHSSGEIAAAYAAGKISLQRAIAIAFFRGHITKARCGNGSMAVVGLNVEETIPLLVEGVDIACENSPQNTTISGDTKLVDQVLTKISSVKPGVFTRRLPVNIAYHSRKCLCPQTSRYEAHPIISCH